MIGSRSWLHLIIQTGLAVVVLLLFWIFGGRDLLMAGEMGTLTIRQMLFAQNQPRHSGSPITLVGFDERTNHELNQHFGFLGEAKRRTIEAYVIRFLRRAKAKSAIFDYSYNGGSNQENSAVDRAMVSSLAGTDNFISALVFERVHSTGIAWQDQSPAIQEALKKNAVTVQGQQHLRMRWAMPAYSLVPPFLALMQSPMRFYAANGTVAEEFSAGHPDPSGILRRWMPAVRYGEHYFPHMTLGAVLEGADTIAFTPDGFLSGGPGRRFRFGTRSLPVIKWYGHDAIHPDYYPEYSHWDVALSQLVHECGQGSADPLCRRVPLPEKPPVSAKDFQGRYVVLGETQFSTADNHPTIFGSQHPGVYIVANVLDNILQDDFVQEAPFWMNLLACLVLLGAGAWVFFRIQTMLFSLVALVSLVIIYFGATYQLYDKANLWLNFLFPVLILLGAYGLAAIDRFQRAEKKRQQLRFAFGKYVSPAVMMNLEKDPNALQLGGHRRELTLLFCDIRGFTTFSESHDPETVTNFLLQYFSVMNGIIKHTYQGSISKLMGDAIMAYWGFPLTRQDHAYLAVCAAMAMREALVEWQQDKDKPPLNIGIGVNTGEVIIGNIGSDDFMDFTVIGDAVNLASRLESLNKEYGTTVIISQSTYALVKDRVEVRSLGHAQVRGKEQPIEIFEPLGLKVDTAPVFKSA